MKKFFSLMLVLVLVNILISCSFFSSNSSLLEKAINKTNNLKKIQGSYNISLHRSKEKPRIILNSNFTFDEDKNKFLNKLYFNFGENGSNLNKTLITYIEDNQLYIKLPDFNKFISLHSTDHVDDYVNNLQNCELLLNNLMKNFKIFINNLLREKNVSFKSKKEVNYLNLTLEHDEIKLLLNNFINENLNTLLDIFVENAVNELNKDDNNLTKTEKELNKNHLKELSNTNYKKFFKNMDISKMDISLSIDKKSSLIKAYETSTKLLINSKTFFLDIDYNLINYGEKCEFHNTNINNTIPYKEFINKLYE
ncbi:hypothetical protein C3495_01290 [Clostridiaceae bacterium 14S0207]|nr:hypothetical protein C3495_01290 [Clostridiaceae bacterium 14S0207]